MLASLPLTLDTLAKHPGLQEPEETGLTFSENAKLKARYYAARTGQICVSEDSGLEIDELDGAPGVQSSRFNGASYSEKFSAIYAELKRRKVASSDARFVCALAVANRTIPNDTSAPTERGRPLTNDTNIASATGANTSSAMVLSSASRPKGG